MNKRMIWSAWLVALWGAAVYAGEARFIPGTAAELPQLVTKTGRTYQLGKKSYPAGTRAKWIAEGRVMAKTPDGFLPKSQKLKGTADNRAYLPPIGDQGSLGSCVFWAGTYYTKTANMKRNDPTLDVTVASNQCSPRFTYNLCNAGSDSGGYGHEPFEICMRYGVASLAQLPYTTDYTTLPSQADFIEGLHRRTTNYVWLWDWSPDAAQIAELKAWLDDGHVAACGVNADTSFENWGPGDAPWVGDTGTTIDDINHMVTVCGYGTGYYLIANSWASDWGSNGYIVVDSDYFENYFSDVMYPLEGTYEPATDYAKLTIKHTQRSDIRELLLTANGVNVWSNSPLPKDMPAGDASGTFATDTRDNLELAIDLTQVAWGEANVVTARVKDAVSSYNGTVTVFSVTYDGAEYSSPVVPRPVPYNAYTSVWVRLYESTDTNVSFTASGAAVGEGSGTYGVTVYKTQASGDVNGQIVLSGTATEGAGADYTISGTNFTLNGATTSATFTVTINDDEEEEPAETVVLTLANVTGGIVEAPDVFTLTINPSDLTGGSVLISQYTETDSGTTPKGIEIWNASASDLTFDSGSNLLDVKVGVNGGVATSVVQIASGTLAAGAVWVIGTSDMSPDVTQAFTFNGDDAVVIALGGVVQDMIGVAGSDPGSAWTSNGVSTANQNIQLKLGTTFGDPDGWTDPSERFEYVDVGSVLTGFGEPPGGWSDVPPVLASIGNKSAVWSNNLSFGVSAADAVDGDTIVLSASNLPAGAVFATVTNAGTVSNTFVWNNVGPLGVYTTTFWAVDNDGADSETVTIAIGDGSGPAEIVFQGFEGSPADTWNIAAVDSGLVLNTTGTADTPVNQRIRTDSYSWQPGESEYTSETLELAEIDVSEYSDAVITLHLSATATEADYGMWPSDSMSFYVALDGADYPGAADLTVTGNEEEGDGISGVLWGFDATGIAATTAGVARTMAPAGGGIAADGLATVQIALPPGTASAKLKAYVVQEYSGYFWNVDDVSLAGIHDGGASNLPPRIAVDPTSTRKVVAVSNNLTFAITGAEIPNDLADAITLRATGLPAGATFPETSGTSVLTNTFSWTPTATGTTVVSFFAGDKDGTNQVDVTIEVYDQQPGGTYYGVFAGLNEYSSSYIGSSSWLSGCVPDAMHMFTNATERGSWRDNPTLQVLTNALGTKAAIRAAISNYASLAVAGDTFLYYHSSHGGNNASDGYTNYTKSVYLCTYDADYDDVDLAADLSGFATGVKVVVMVDACFSGGLFRSAAGTRMFVPATGTFDLAERVSQIMATDRAEKIARGVKGVEKTITTNEIGWVTAADYWQYSWDGDNGGAFTEAAIAGWTDGTCDNATYGNQDGYANFYEIWNYAKDIAVGYPGEYDPNDGTSYQTDAQAFNTNVLLSVVAGIAGDGPVADQPPSIALNPAGTNKTTTFGNALSFTVTATDLDGLAVTLTASNLPAGATAPDTNGTGSVATTFNWTPSAAQVGVYHVVFAATDDDGTTVQGVQITVRDGSVASDLFISEYVEGSSNNKFVEIFNGTGAGIDLSNYSLRQYNNGSSTMTYSLALSGTLADGNVYVVENSNETLGVAADLSTGSSVMTFNGNDAVALAKSDANIDVVGTIGVNVTNLANVTKVRKSTVTAGTTTYDPLEWDDYAVDTVDYLGSHVFGADEPTAPAFSAIPGQNATRGELFTLDVANYVTGNPAPTLALDSSDADPADYGFAGGALSFTPSATGTFQFVFSATNGSGTASATAEVVVAEALAELLAPVIQAASDVQANRFNANWLPSANATGYRLDVGTYAEGGEGVQSLLASNAATSPALITGDWIGTGLGGATYVIMTQATASIVSPAFSTVGFTNLTVDFRARTYGGTTKSNITVSISSDNGTNWTMMAVRNPLSGSTWSTIPTVVDTAHLGGIQTRIRWQSLDAGAGIGVGVSNLVVQGWSSSGGPPAPFVPGYEDRDVGNVTTFVVTGLTESVTYLYRVKAYNASSNSPYSAITSVVTTASSGTPPVLNPIGGQEVFVGYDLQFQVSATPTDADAVTLTASNLPAGAAFYPTNEVGTFLWTAAAPTGEYSVVFYASDKDGSDGEAVGIYVYPLPQFQTLTASNGAPATASFRSVAGQTYRLEYSLDLQADPIVWAEADSEIGDGNVITLSDTNAVDVKRYYRIVAP